MLEMDGAHEANSTGSMSRDNCMLVVKAAEKEKDA